jgi:hypothetical protein
MATVTEMDGNLDSGTAGIDGFLTTGWAAIVPSQYRRMRQNGSEKLAAPHGKDEADDEYSERMTLSAGEFLRCFPQHGLPSGFVKARHYGLLVNR